jgi:hypothetical protein
MTASRTWQIEIISSDHKANSFGLMFFHLALSGINVIKSDWWGRLMILKEV